MRREWWLQVNSFGPGTCYNYEVKLEPEKHGSAIEEVVHVFEVLPGDVILSAEEAAKVREILEDIQFYDYEALKQLHTAIKEETK